MSRLWRTDERTDGGKWKIGQCSVGPEPAITSECFSETTILFEAVLNALPSVDSFFLMGGTLTAYIVFKELDKAGANVSRSEILFVLALKIVPNQAHNNLNPVLRPSLSAPHHPIRAHHGGHHHRPPPPRLWTSVALLCFSCRGAPPYLIIRCS